MSAAVNFLLLHSLYNGVFDSDGSMKVCGRKKCSELIRACQKFWPMQEGFYGNPETGFVNADAIHGLYKSASEKYFTLTKE